MSYEKTKGRMEMEKEHKQEVTVSTVYILHGNLIRCTALNVHVYSSECSRFASTRMGQKKKRCLKLLIPSHCCTAKGKALIEELRQMSLKKFCIP